MDIHFNGIAEGQAAILDDSLEPYFALLRRDEIALKTEEPMTACGRSELEAECRRRYSAAVLEFTPREVEALHWYLEKIHGIMAQYYPGLVGLPWSLIKVQDRIERCAPHTRGAHIILPESLLRKAAWLWQHRVEVWPDTFWPKDFIPEFCGILGHEQLHVLQRLHPAQFHPLYTEILGFVAMAALKPCPWMTEHWTVNPDATDRRWVLPVKVAGRKRWIWPFETLAYQAKAGRFCTRYLGVEVCLEYNGFHLRLRPNGTPYRFDLHRFRGLRKKHGLSVTRFDHPRELSADIFERLIYDDIWDPSRQRLDAARELTPLKDWFERNLTFSD